MSTAEDARAGPFSCTYQSKEHSIAGKLWLTATTLEWEATNKKRKLTKTFHELVALHEAPGKPVIKVTTSGDPGDIKAPGFRFEFTGPTAMQSRELFCAELNPTLKARLSAQRRRAAADAASSAAGGTARGASSAAGGTSGDGGAAAAADGADAQQRAAALQLSKRRELAAAYDALVGGGVMTVSEFAESVKRQMAVAAAATAAGDDAGHVVVGATGASVGMERGFDNEMLQRATKNTSSQSLFTVTRQFMAQVFAERPEVRMAHERNVPGKMTEEQFWEQFLQAERVHQPGKRHRDEMFASCLAEYDRTTRLAEAAQKRAQVAHQLALDLEPLDRAAGAGDVDGDDPSAADGAAAATAAAAAAQRGAPTRSIVERLNRHSEVVAQSNVRHAEASFDARLRDELQLSDLVHEHDSGADVQLFRPTARLGGMAAAASASSSQSEAAEVSAASSARAVSGVPRVYTAPASVLECVTSTARALATVDALGRGRALASGAVAGAAPSEVRDAAVPVFELLRHYWRTVTAGGAASAPDRVARLQAGLRVQRDELQSAELPGGCHAQLIGMIDAALAAVR